MGPDRLELSTSVLSGPRSNHLSYGPTMGELYTLQPLIDKGLGRGRVHAPTRHSEERSDVRISGSPHADGSAQILRVASEWEKGERDGWRSRFQSARFSRRAEGALLRMTAITPILTFPRGGREKRGQALSRGGRRGETGGGAQLTQAWFRR